MRKLSWYLCALVCWASCTQRVENPILLDESPAIYPDYIGVTIPAEIAPLNFNITAGDIDMVDVVVRGSKGGESVARREEICMHRVISPISTLRTGMS